MLACMHPTICKHTKPDFNTDKKLYWPRLKTQMWTKFWHFLKIFSQPSEAHIIQPLSEKNVFFWLFWINSYFMMFPNAFCTCESIQQPLCPETLVLWELPNSQTDLQYAFYTNGFHINKKIIIFILFPVGILSKI